MTLELKSKGSGWGVASPEWSGIVGRLYVEPGDAANGDVPRRGDASLSALNDISWMAGRPHSREPN
jgi:hypothetical protein